MGMAEPRRESNAKKFLQRSTALFERPDSSSAFVVLAGISTSDTWNRAVEWGSPRALALRRFCSLNARRSTWVAYAVRLQVIEVDLERRRIHRDQHVARVAGRVKILCGREAELKPLTPVARVPARERADQGKSGKRW